MSPWGGKYEPAMKITDPIQAAEYLEACIQHTMSFGKTRAEAEAVEKSNIGYFAGYYDHETRIRVEQLFFCEHPVFGPASEGEPTAEEAFKMGMELGRTGKLPEKPIKPKPSRLVRMDG